MQFLTLALILACTLGTFFTDVGAAPAALKFLPEGLSLIALAYILLAGSRQRFQLVAPRYWLAFGALALVVLCGVLINRPGPGTLIGGMRFYLRAMPFFFLPAVCEFSEAQLRSQLRLLLGIALVQLPVSVYQRYQVMAHGHWSGDPVTGTLLISSVMSIFLIAATCIAAALMLRGRLSKTAFLALFLLFAVPTTINETKSTVLLLPLGLLTTLLIGSPRGRRLRFSISALALLALFAALYVPVYDYFASANNPYPYTVESFFSDRRAVVRYVDQGTDLGSRREAGRWDALVVPLQTFASDPVHLMFGVGVGNGSASSLGIGYTGEYNGLFGRYTIETSAAAFIVEIGVLGLALVLWLYWLILRDSLSVATHDRTIVGAVALGWLGVTLVMAVATFYKSLHYFESLSYLFWYFSGLVAAQSVRLGLQQRSAPISAVTPRLSPRADRTAARAQP
jgi:hypothetical protein